MAHRGKRLTYWTGDGKRHWTPRLNITLDLEESAEFGPLDTRYACRSYCKEPLAASAKGSVHPQATAPDR